MNEIQKCGENRRASERFAIPGVGAIILKNTDGAEHVLLQDRLRPGIPAEHGLWEVPAGKIRAFESIFDALRREIKEETGLIVTEILGENEAVLYSGSDYEVINFTPFSCAQNLKGSYPIMVFVFLCRTSGDFSGFSSESRNHRWVRVSDLKVLLDKSPELFYPMHVDTLKKFVSVRVLAGET